MSLYEHEFVCIYSSSDAEPVQNFACYIVLFWRSSFEAITIITAGGNCRTLSYGLNNAGFHRDANTYDVTSRASLSMATNAMDGHSNVSSVITLSYVVVILDYTGFMWNEQKNTRFRVFMKHEISPVCNIVIEASSYSRNIGRMQSDNNLQSFETIL